MAITPAKPNTVPSGVLSAEDRAAIVQRHFTVTTEEQLLARLRFAHALRALPALVAALKRGRKVPPDAPVLGAPDLEAAVQTPPEPALARVASPNLRDLLGLK